MIDAPLGANLEELMRQLALLIDRADQTGDGDALPSDSGEQAILKHWINQGYQLFMRSEPRWSFNKRQVEITLPLTAGPDNVNGETWRYRLPAFVRGFPAPCEFNARQSDTGVSTLAVRPPEWIDRQIALDGTGSAGTPCYFSCRPVPVSDRRQEHGLGGGDEWEAVFYPRPSREIRLSAIFPVRWTQLVEPEDRTLCGPEHDQAIVHAAEYLYVSRDDERADVRAEAKARWLESFAQSVRLDYAKRLPALEPRRRPRDIERVTWNVGDIGGSKKITPIGPAS